MARRTGVYPLAWSLRHLRRARDEMRWCDYQHALRKARFLVTRSQRAELASLRRQLFDVRQEGGEVRWRDKPIRYCDGRSLFHQLADIYLCGTYDFRSLNKNPTILDIGANIGVAVRRCRERFPGAHITAFEPDPNLVKVLRENVRVNWTDRETEIVPCAAWIEDGEASFRSTGGDTGALDARGGTTVRTVNVAKFCAKPVDFLKLDVEGSELPILSHLDAAGCLTNIKSMFVELHHWNGDRLCWHEALALLDRSGFEYRIKSDLLGQPAAEIPFEHIAYPASLAGVHAWQRQK